jgi:peptidoglycan hydrolase CwlO-like protein
MQFLENENRIKTNEISELLKDVKHLMDERSEMKRKIFKDKQKLKSLQQIVIKDLKTSLSKSVSGC